MLNFHLTNVARLTTVQLTAGRNIRMLNDENVIVQSGSPSITLSPAVIGSAPVVRSDSSATNGELHVVSRMLLPSFVFTTMIDQIVANNPTMATLVTQPQLSGFVDFMNTNAGLTVCSSRVSGVWFFLLRLSWLLDL